MNTGSKHSEGSNQAGEDRSSEERKAEESQGLGNLLDTWVSKEESPAHWVFGDMSGTENTGAGTDPWGEHESGSECGLSGARWSGGVTCKVLGVRRGSGLRVYIWRTWTRARETRGRGCDRWEGRRWKASSVWCGKRSTRGQRAEEAEDEAGGDGETQRGVLLRTREGKEFFQKEAVRGGFRPAEARLAHGSARAREPLQCRPTHQPGPSKYRTHVHSSRKEDQEAWAWGEGRPAHFPLWGGGQLGRASRAPSTRPLHPQKGSMCKSKDGRPGCLDGSVS